MSIPALGSSGASAIVSASPSISLPSLGHSITVRLTRDNFFLWKTQAVPVLQAHQFFGFVTGTDAAPSMFLTEG